MTKLEGRLKAKEDKLNIAHADLVLYKAKREKLINSYMASAEFKDLMTIYDDGQLPVHFWLVESQL